MVRLLEEHFDALVDSPDAAIDLPELTLRGGGVIMEGETGSVTIVADQAPEVDTSVVYNAYGSATEGGNQSGYATLRVLLNVQGHPQCRVT